LVLIYIHILSYISIYLETQASHYSQTYGGTDDPQNIKNLTPLEHAEAHKKLYEEYGKIEDYLAWKGLEGFLGKEEIIYQLMVENGKKLGKRMMDEKKGFLIWSNRKQKNIEMV